MLLPFDFGEHSTPIEIEKVNNILASLLKEYQLKKKRKRKT